MHLLHEFCINEGRRIMKTLQKIFQKISEHIYLLFSLFWNWIQSEALKKYLLTINFLVGVFFGLSVMFESYGLLNGKHL